MIEKEALVTYACLAFGISIMCYFFLYAQNVYPLSWAGILIISASLSFILLDKGQ